MIEGTYQITPLHVGTCRLGKDHVLGEAYSIDDRMEFALISFLVCGCGRTALVDLGPKSVGNCNEMFRRYGFFRTMPDSSTPDDIVQPHGSVLDCLARLEISPEEVTDIIFTHLHADHHGMHDARDGGACEDFPNAVFHFSERGWRYNLEGREDGHWNTYLDWAFGDFLLRMTDAGRAFPGDNAEIAPGLGTVYLGGHSVCSQGVFVESGQGRVVIAGDDLYRYELLENAVVARIHTSRERFMEVSRMLAEWAAGGTIVLPAHEPAVVELHARHGAMWLAEAKVLSMRAGKGYLSACDACR